MFCVAVGGSHFCWAVLLALIMPPDGCFVPDPPSCVSSPLYMIGVERMLPSGYGLLDSLGGDILISWALCLGCALRLLLGSRLLCHQTMLLLLPLVLGLEARVVVVCWALAYT